MKIYTTCTCGHDLTEHGPGGGQCTAEVLPVAQPGLCVCDEFTEAAGWRDAT